MIKYTMYTSLFVTLGHLTWPAFRYARHPFDPARYFRSTHSDTLSRRKQAIGLKAFIISSSTLAGLVFGAEKYLLRFESQQRETENDMRRQARNDLARQGIIATETEIKKWKGQRDEKEKARAAREAETTA